MDLGHTGGRGTPVIAVQKGIVERVLRDDQPRSGFGGYGNGVVVRHHDGTWALYAHLDQARVHEGSNVAAGDQVGTMGNTSNGRFRGMGVHLHLELRHAKADGSSPFPGPYRTYNLDPRPWLAAKGLTFNSRGGFEIRPDTEMTVGAPVWGRLGGIDPYPRERLLSWSLPETSLAGAPEGGWVNEYQPVDFDRDVRFGLTPVEWAAAGAGLLVLTGTATALLIRRRPTQPNRRRSSRRRRRTSRRR